MPSARPRAVCLLSLVLNVDIYLEVMQRLPLCRPETECVSCDVYPAAWACACRARGAWPCAGTPSSRPPTSTPAIATDPVEGPGVKAPARGRGVAEAWACAT